MAKILKTLEEVQKHNTETDAWIIVADKVYDITKWAKQHPGGRVILYYKGQDATEPVNAFHPDKKKLEKYMSSRYIGDLDKSAPVTPLIKEFRELEKQVRAEGLWKPVPSFYIAHLVSILFMEVLAAAIMWKFHDSWAGWAATVAVLVTSQIQAGWLQHDFGHLSVFQDYTYNTRVHQFVICGLKAASMDWWKSRHNRHHAKTNVMHKDPDIRNDPLFLFGENQGKMNLVTWKFIPWQNIYWFLLGPPTVTTFLFLYDNLRHVFKFKCFTDFLWITLFLVRWHFTYTPVIGGWNAAVLYFTMRFFESLWFTWVTSMNHLPMEIDYDKERDWVSLHVVSTQNVEQSFFNDWFTGHLNFQIEHHLFPTMPRHNYVKVHQRIMDLCRKHGLKPRVRPLLSAFNDILEALRIAVRTWEKEQQLKNH